MEDYKEKYEQAIERAKSIVTKDRTEKNHWVTFAVENIFPELKKSDEEKMRECAVRILKSIARNIFLPEGCKKEDVIAWLEKQKDTNVLIQEASEKAYTEGMRVERKHWVEKQGTPAKLSEEEQNKFAKGVLSSCALSFINYLDAHKYESKMCVSNGECEDIENSFLNAMWDRLHRYYCKYIEKQGEQKPAWSDMDEENLQHCCLAISVDSLHTYEDKQDMKAWLQSLKERIGGK